MFPDKARLTVSVEGRYLDFQFSNEQLATPLWKSNKSDPFYRSIIKSRQRAKVDSPPFFLVGNVIELREINSGLSPITMNTQHTKVLPTTPTLGYGESYVRDVGLIGKKKGWTVVFGGNSSGRPCIARFVKRIGIDEFKKAI